MIFKKTLFFLFCQALPFSSQNFVGMDHRESSNLKHELPLREGHRDFVTIDLGNLRYGYQ